MDNNCKQHIQLKIKRFDLSDDPEIIEKVFEVDPSMDFDIIRAELYKFCEASLERQVLKIRNGDNFLIPISLLLENLEPFYYIEVALISCFAKKPNSLAQDAYVDALCKKLKSLETRVTEAEFDLPEFESRREAFQEETVSTLLDKVKFLNRRFDELYPEHKEKMLSLGAGSSKW